MRISQLTDIEMSLFPTYRDNSTYNLHISMQHVVFLRNNSTGECRKKLCKHYCHVFSQINELQPTIQQNKLLSTYHKNNHAGFLHQEKRASAT